MAIFSKKSSGLDLETRALKVEMIRDIIMPNICMKLYSNPSINVGSRAMKQEGHDVPAMLT